MPIFSFKSSVSLTKNGIWDRNVNKKKELHLLIHFKNLFLLSGWIENAVAQQGFCEHVAETGLKKEEEERYGSCPHGKD